MTRNSCLLINNCQRLTFNETSDKKQSPLITPENVKEGGYRFGLTVLVSNPTDVYTTRPLDQSDSEGWVCKARTGTVTPTTWSKDKVRKRKWSLVSGKIYESFKSLSYISILTEIHTR